MVSRAARVIETGMKKANSKVVYETFKVETKRKKCATIIAEEETGLVLRDETFTVTMSRMISSFWAITTTLGMLQFTMRSSKRQRANSKMVNPRKGLVEYGRPKLMKSLTVAHQKIPGSRAVDPIINDTHSPQKAT